MSKSMEKSLEQLKKEAEERVRSLNLDHWVKQCALSGTKNEHHLSENSYYYDGKEGDTVSVRVDRDEDGNTLTVNIHNHEFPLTSQLIVYVSIGTKHHTDLLCFKDGAWVDIIIDEGKKAEMALRVKEEREQEERERRERDKFLPL